jgi:hypothetical protein
MFEIEHGKCEILERLTHHKRRIMHMMRNLEAGLELYSIDLSDWKLSLTDMTPCIRVHDWGLAGKSAEELVLQWRQFSQEGIGGQWLTLVLMDGQRNDIREYASILSDPRFLIIDAKDQADLLAAPSMEAKLLSMVRSSIPLTMLAPYQFGGAVTGSRFFNRMAEVERILRHPDSNFAIIGIRRIGKTSLLREIRRRFLDSGEPESRLVWRDCSTTKTPEAFITEVVRCLNPRILSRLERVGPLALDMSDFLQRMAKEHHGRITLMLDEVDSLLDYPRQRYDLPTLFRSWINSGSCRLLVCGFSKLMAELSDRSSPYHMLFEPLLLGPFGERSTRELIMQPMLRLGISIPNEAELVSRIHGDHSGHPALLQFCCNELIQHMEEKDPKSLDVDSLSVIYGSRQYKQQIINVFRDNTMSQDKLMVYALLNYFSDKLEFSQGDMLSALQRCDCPNSIEEIDRICDRLTEGGVMVKKNKNFVFAIPLLASLLKSEYKIAELLEATKKEVWK